LIFNWKLPSIEFKNSIETSDFDLDNSATNDDWDGDFSHCQAQVDDALTSFSSACMDASKQLGFFAEGEFDQSIIKIKEQERAERLLQEQKERKEKQSVTITKDGKECLFSIEWKQMDSPPCDPEKIRHIKTDGKIWLIVDDDNILYRSEDRKNWQPVQSDAFDNHFSVDGVNIVNGIWILMGGYYDDGFYYSDDARVWRKSGLPDDSDLSRTKNLVYFNGLWLWRFTARQKYSYVEKGLIFDSTETSTYDKTIIFSTEALGEPWKRWDQTPSLSEGIVVNCMRSIPGKPLLLAFCDYDSYYTLVRKKTDTAAFVMYCLPKKDWHNCTWEGENYRYGDDTIIASVFDKLICFCSGKVLASDKGYTWHANDGRIDANSFFDLNGFAIFAPNRGEFIHLSQDGKEFKKVMLEEGQWSYFAANEKGALAVYSPDGHETFLRFGDYFFEIKG
jgi:hypothetical protein